jgi:hypothetical protein
MPGLLRGVARTAVVAGTASAVNGRVQRRQAERFAERDAEIAAERQQAYQQQVATPSGGATGTGSADTLEQLKDLAALKADGILTEDEFAAQKAKILGS